MFTLNPRIKRTLWGILLGFSLVLFPLLSHALTVQEVPNPQQQYGGWVTDMANILSNQTENQLNRMISELESTTGAELAVVTVPTTAPYPNPKAFATALFNHWGIGKAGINNGVLFLTSVGDRRVEIETGYGVELLIPDDTIATLINTEIIPRLRRRDWTGGILAGTQALVKELKAVYPARTREETGENTSAIRMP
ncbi:MAG: TPM domain-containing protein [Chroococcales cyanobacterium]